MTLHSKRTAKKGTASRVLPGVLALYLLFFGVAARPAEQKPSHGDLNTRVEAYWDALQAGKKIVALEYVYPEDLELFLSRPNPLFTEPVIVSCEISEEGTTAQVKVSVTRYLPFMASPVRVEVPQQWILSNGTWYAREFPPGTPYVSAQNQTSLDPEEVERRISVVRAQLAFEGDEIHFGAIRKGVKSTVEMGYELAGNEAMEITPEGLPEGLTVRGLENGKLTPGPGRRIQFDYQCDAGHGSMALRFALRARHLEVEVPYLFTIKAEVYSPVSATPAAIRMDKEESEKSILLTNNSRSVAAITTLNSEKDSLETPSLPLVLMPGQSARLQVRLKKKVEETNYKDKITLVFEKPVEDLDGLLIPVTVNPSEPVVDIPLGMTRAEIEALLKKIRGTIKP